MGSTRETREIKEINQPEEARQSPADLQQQKVHSDVPSQSETVEADHRAKRPSSTLEEVQPTPAHLDAEYLYIQFYMDHGGMEQMAQEHPEEAGLLQELWALIQKGTPQQKAALRELRVQRNEQYSSNAIETIRPTVDHLEAKYLYDRSHRKPGGMKQMEEEHPEEARLIREISTIKRKGTAQQKAVLQALRRERTEQTNPLIAIEGVQPTTAHLKAWLLYTHSYMSNGGVEKMAQEHPEQARLMQETRAIKHRGTPQQKVALRALLAQHRDQTNSKIAIEHIHPTPAHLEAENLYRTRYRGPGSLKQMEQEHPEEARLVREVHAMKDRGTAEQKAALQTLRAQRRGQDDPPSAIEHIQPTLAHLEAERLYSTYYNRQEGLKQIEQEHPEEVRLMRELWSLKRKGTVEQKAALQALRVQRREQSKK